MLHPSIVLGLLVEHLLRDGIRRIQPKLNQVLGIFQKLNCVCSEQYNFQKHLDRRQIRTQLFEHESEHLFLRFSAQQAFSLCPC